MLSRFQHAVGLLEELQVCSWNLAEKAEGPGGGSWHSKPEGNERLLLAAGKKENEIFKESWNPRGNDI